MGTRILAGRYELLDRIGDGGMAIVYKARCRLLNRFVAIKILKPDFIKDVKFIENFRKESQAAASLTHPNIVNVYDVGREGNIHYIVMELIEGKPLSEVIREEAPLNYARVIDIAKQMASALSLAHKNQIIHRDVKPHNILITRDGVAKITDFGIAKALNSATIVGNEGTVMGSVHYFSPEQARGGYVDEKSDIYSLGIVLYEMLTGRVPFDGDNPVSVALMHVNDEMVPPSRLADGIPPRLEQIVVKATDKFQVNRYKSADELFEELSNLEFVTSILNVAAAGGRKRRADSPDLQTEDKSAGKQEREKEGTEEMKSDRKAGKGKKKFRVNKTRLVAVVLALALGIPASIVIANMISGIGAPKEVAVPDVVGYTYERAETALAELNLLIERGDEVYNAEYDEGRVVSQDPEEGSLVKEGKAIIVNVSRGTNAGTVPKITNMPREAAEVLLDRYDYRVGLVTPQKNEAPRGTVLSQEPEAGTEAKPGSAINFVVSEGVETGEVIMPNLTGTEINAAKMAIEGLGLQFSEPEYQTSETVAKDRVVWQEYPAGSPLSAGTPVKLRVSLGKEEEQAPPEPPAPPESVRYTISFEPAANQIFLLTVVLTDDTGTRNIISSEQRIKDNGPETVELIGTGTGSVTIIFDDIMVSRVNVNFETGEIY